MQPMRHSTLLTKMVRLASMASMISGYVTTRGTWSIPTHGTMWSELQQGEVQLRASPRALRDNLTISRALLATPSASRAAASRVTAMTASAPTSPRKLRPTARPRAVYHVDLGSVRRGTWCRHCAHIITANKNRGKKLKRKKFN